MKCIELIKKSNRQINVLNKNAFNQFDMKGFEKGALWMNEALAALTLEQNKSFKKSNSFFLYGCLKYGLSIITFIITFTLLSKISYWLFLLAIISFYLVEINFLFLFPLLIDGVEKPLKQSIRAVFKMGYFKVLINVIVIAAYMVLGFLNVKQPLKAWYVGCLAILIWYNDEIRNRI